MQLKYIEILMKIIKIKRWYKEEIKVYKIK